MDGEPINSTSSIQPAPLRLRLDSAALVANWRWLRDKAEGAACGAAIKADGYGLGARGVLDRLARAGCRDFYVATWGEATALGALPDGASLSVFHGVRAADVPAALASAARPTLNSAAQVQRWKSAASDRPCDVMVDTGMNRLGLSMAEVRSGLLDGLSIDTLMSHLASADEDVARNGTQLAQFRAVCAQIPARRYSLANSAGICLGADYCFDLVRPGLAIYGGIPRAEAARHIRQVATPMAEILQVRHVGAGEGVGYNHQWHAREDCRVAIIHMGYADGYLRSFTNRGCARHDGAMLPVVGRVSMDLVALVLPPGHAAEEGDWVAIEYALPAAAAQSGLSQYELLTGLGQRFERRWTE